MKKESKKPQKLISLFLLFLLLMNFPFVSLFNAPSLFGSIPLLYIYVFCCWLSLIILTAILINRKNTQKPKDHA